MPKILLKRYSNAPFYVIGEGTSESGTPRDRSYESEFPSLSNSAIAVYAKRRLSIEGLPRPGTTDATFACVLRYISRRI